MMSMARCGVQSIHCCCRTWGILSSSYPSVLSPRDLVVFFAVTVIQTQTKTMVEPLTIGC